MTAELQAKLKERARQYREAPAIRHFILVVARNADPEQCYVGEGGEYSDGRLYLLRLPSLIPGLRTNLCADMDTLKKTLSNCDHAYYIEHID